MLGREVRGSFTSELGAREESVLRRGTKTPMNDPILANFRFSYLDMSVSLRGEFRLCLALGQIGRAEALCTDVERRPRNLRRFVGISRTARLMHPRGHEKVLPSLDEILGCHSIRRVARCSVRE
jgi:hypothetical protein